MVIASDQRERGNPTKSSRGIRDAVAISVWDCFVTSFLAMTAFFRQFWDVSSPCHFFTGISVFFIKLALFSLDALMIQIERVYLNFALRGDCHAPSGGSQ